MASDSEARGTPALPALFWFAVGLSALTASYAVLTARGLAYDGSFYLLAIAADRSFHFVEPARVSVQFLQQLPVVLAARIGIQNLWTLARLFTLGMDGWPVALTALCWLALTDRDKIWIVGPLINLVFAIPAANFVGISEGAIAACLLWLAVLLVRFRLAQPFGSLAALSATVGCAVAHEAMLPGLFLISWLALSQAKELRGFPRFVALLVALVSVAGALYMARWIVAPRSTIERGDFLVDMLGGFAGSPAAPNLPAIASVLAALFIAIAFATPRQSTFVTTAGSIAVLVCGIAFALAPAALVSPSRFFAARGMPVAVTTILATICVLPAMRKSRLGRFAAGPCVAIVLVLTTTQALMQVVATSIWHHFVVDLRMLVASKRGVIPHAEAMASLDPDGSRFRRELLESWSVEPLSILLAPGGRILAVVEPAAAARWVPYRFSEANTLPHLPQLDWSHFARMREP